MVLNFNGRELLEVVLPSLAKQVGVSVEMIVVDNGSVDDSCSYLADHWPEVRLVAIPENVGVTAALNECLRASDREFICLLNNDMELEPDCLVELLLALQAHPEAACAAAKLLDYYDRTMLDGAGDVYEWSGKASRRGQGVRDDGQYQEPTAIFGACGGAAVYRRSAIEAVGPFDAQFFAIYEDVDWAFRAQMQGYSCRYVPSAVVYHMGSATIGAALSDFTLYHGWRNSIWVVFKSYPRDALFRHGHTFVSSQLHNLVWAIQTKRTRFFFQVWLDVLKGMPAILAKRRVVQSRRTVGLSELEAIMRVGR